MASQKAPADDVNDNLVHRSAVAASAVWGILAEDSSAARRTLQAADFVEELLDLAEALPVTNSSSSATSSASEITSGAEDIESSQNRNEREHRQIHSRGAVYGPVDDENDGAVAVEKAAKRDKPRCGWDEVGRR